MRRALTIGAEAALLVGLVFAVRLLDVPLPGLGGGRTESRPPGVVWFPGEHRSEPHLLAARAPFVVRWQPPARLFTVHDSVVRTAPAQPSRPAAPTSAPPPVPPGRPDRPSVPDPQPAAAPVAVEAPPLSLQVPVPPPISALPPVPTPPDPVVALPTLP